MLNSGLSLDISTFSEAATVQNSPENELLSSPCLKIAAAAAPVKERRREKEREVVRLSCVVVRLCICSTRTTSDPQRQTVKVNSSQVV